MSIEESSRPGKKERAFEMSLPTVVSGIDPAGRKFEERTDLHSISSQEASFWLQTPLMIGSKVLLALDVPRTIILEKPLRLCLSGSVVYVRSEEGRSKRQLLSASLDKTFRLFPES
jgi:hypothetical protein